MLFRFGEMFCGPGGMALGAMRARARGADGEEWCAQPTWAVDLDRDSCITYRRNIHGDDPDAPVFHGDAKQLDVEALPDIDAFLFGFPCNDFSSVGSRLGLEGSYGELYREGIRAIDAKRPSWFVAENVAGIRGANDSRALAQILSDMSRAGGGYRLVPHLYNFEEYGVPQQRKRVVIVGIRADHAEAGIMFRPPAPSGRIITAREALDRPIPPGTENVEHRPISPEVRARLQATRPGENVWQAQKRPDFPDFARLNVKSTHLSLIYRRLDPDKPAYTILANGGGGTRGYHWDEPRPLTDRERARLQGFPDSFGFHGGPGSVRCQVGMAVPPPAAERIIAAVLMSFARQTYESVEANIEWSESGMVRTLSKRGGKTMKQFAFHCEPSLSNRPRVAEIMRSMLLAQHPRALKWEKLLEEVERLAPGAPYDTIRKAYLRMNRAGEMVMKRENLKLTEKGYEFLVDAHADGRLPLLKEVEQPTATRKKTAAKNAAKNAVAQDGHEVRDNGKSEKATPAAKPKGTEVAHLRPVPTMPTSSVTKDASGRSGSETNISRIPEGTEVAEAIAMVARGLGVLRSAIYGTEISDIVGKEGAERFCDGVLETDRVFEMATREVRTAITSAGKVSNPRPARA